jgi:hypothetical protein
LSPALNGEPSARRFLICSSFAFAALLRVQVREISVRSARFLRGGSEGNARLTGLTGLVLLALFAVEGLTILAIRPLLSVHIFVGLLLIPPVALKLAATGYRLLRYYARAAEYVRKGPPMLLMRMVVAPGLVAATVVVFATGVALLAVGAQAEGSCSGCTRRASWSGSVRSASTGQRRTRALARRRSEP